MCLKKVRFKLIWTDGKFFLKGEKVPQSKIETEVGQVVGWKVPQTTKD